ncbi:MAG: hypothetical protein ACI4V2_00545 [Alloprevotella sp.]
MTKKLVFLLVGLCRLPPMEFCRPENGLIPPKWLAAFLPIRPRGAGIRPDFSLLMAVMRFRPIKKAPIRASSSMVTQIYMERVAGKKTKGVGLTIRWLRFDIE